MKKFAPSRELSLAPPLCSDMRSSQRPPRRSLWAPVIFTLGLAVSIGMFGHEASAVPGAPALPNLNFAQLSRWPDPFVAIPSGNAHLGRDIFEAFNHGTSPLVYPTQPRASARPGDVAMWDGQGALPGRFEAPWHVADSNFDPSFRTPYWSEAGGFRNIDEAPWNQGMAGRYGLGSAIYNSGLAYLGKADYTAVLPVWESGQTGVAQPPALRTSQAGVAL